MYNLKRGYKKDFADCKLLPGETALILDTKELAFCFGEETEILKVSEEVDKETAERLFSRIDEFLRNNPRLRM